MSEEKPPDTVPVPTPPPSGERPPDISVRGRRRYKRGRPKEAPGRSIEEIVTDVERKEGEAPAAMVLIVIRSYRALQVTNEAQKKVIRELGAELAALKKKKRSR